MKNCLFVLVLSAALILGAGCERPASVKDAKKQQVESEPEKVVAKQSEEKKEEPLLLDEDPPLLLDEGDGSDKSDGPKADNSRCFVCHMNMMEEDIVVIHAKANIGCKDCHGESDAHIADESWASGGNGTAPDRIFPKSKINPFCMGCHTKEKIDKPQHKQILANMQMMVCTDCHGKHKILTPRKCKWK